MAEAERRGEVRECPYAKEMKYKVEVSATSAVQQSLVERARMSANVMSDGGAFITGMGNMWQNNNLQDAPGGRHVAWIFVATLLLKKARLWLVLRLFFCF